MNSRSLAMFVLAVVMLVGGGLAGRALGLHHQVLLDPDVNDDGVVDIADLAQAFGCTAGTVAARPDCAPADLDGSGRVDATDTNLIGQQFGTSGYARSRLLVVNNPSDAALALLAGHTRTREYHGVRVGGRAHAVDTLIVRGAGAGTTISLDEAGLPRELRSAAGDALLLEPDEHGAIVGRFVDHRGESAAVALLNDGMPLREPTAAADVIRSGAASGGHIRVTCGGRPLSGAAVDVALDDQPGSEAPMHLRTTEVDPGTFRYELPAPDSSGESFVEQCRQTLRAAAAQCERSHLTEGIAANSVLGMSAACAALETSGPGGPEAARACRAMTADFASSCQLFDRGAADDTCSRAAPARSNRPAGDRLTARVTHPMMVTGQPVSWNPAQSPDIAVEMVPGFAANNIRVTPSSPRAGDSYELVLAGDCVPAQTSVSVAAVNDLGQRVAEQTVQLRTGPPSRISMASRKSDRFHRITVRDDRTGRTHHLTVTLAPAGYLYRGTLNYTRRDEMPGCTQRVTFRMTDVLISVDWTGAAEVIQYHRRAEVAPLQCGPAGRSYYSELIRDRWKGTATMSGQTGELRFEDRGYVQRWHGTVTDTGFSGAMEVAGPVGNGTARGDGTFTLRRIR